MSSQHRLVYQEFGNAQDPPQPDNILRSSQEQSPRIQASRKGRQGKTVTVITNLEADDSTLELLLKQLKNQCGAGGTIKDGEIEIQGDHAAKILQILIKLGYKAKISGG